MGETTHCISGRINNALDTPANGLQGISADACGALREAFDALAGFGGEVLGCLAAGGVRGRLAVACVCVYVYRVQGRVD